MLLPFRQMSASLQDPIINNYNRWIQLSLAKNMRVKSWVTSTGTTFSHCSTTLPAQGTALKQVSLGQQTTIRAFLVVIIRLQMSKTTHLEKCTNIEQIFTNSIQTPESCHLLCDTYDLSNPPAQGNHTCMRLEEL